jgi:hypothetical protein
MEEILCKQAFALQEAQGLEWQAEKAQSVMDDRASVEALSHTIRLTSSDSGVSAASAHNSSKFMSRTGASANR